MTLEQIAQTVGQDPFARFLGIELIEIGEGYSKVAVTVDERMLNSHRTAHGGVIFSLADVAFALASNSHGQLAVALNVSISYVAPVAPGTRLIAEATEESLGRRIGMYRLTVTSEEGTLVATCQATAYRKNQPVVPTNHCIASGESMQTAERVTHFKESVIRKMTRLAMQHEAINLSQGFPDFDPAPALQEAAIQAIRDGHHQYSPTWGIAPLRAKLAELYTEWLGWAVDPAVHVTVACGVTEAMNSVMLGLLDPGDEIVIIEPAHENYIPSAIFCGAKAVSVPLDEPGYRLNAERLEAAVTPRTKAVILNTPHNPTGRVFDEGEMAGVIEVVLKHDLVLITDEIYDHILYDGRQHVYPGSIKAIADRTITVSGLSKTYAITGWRLGYVIAPEYLSQAVRPVHDFMTVCAPTPLQVAAVTALNLPQSYYDQMTADYHVRRDTIVGILTELGFRTPTPEGSYYVLADYSHVPIPQAQWDSTRFAEWMTEVVGVAVVPGCVFYSQPGYGDHSVRFAFPKKIETLQAARERMERMLGDQ